MKLVFKILIDIKFKGFHMRKHWVTSLIGAVGAACNTLVPLIIDGHVSTQSVILSFVILLLGAFASDYNKVQLKE